MCARRFPMQLDSDFVRSRFPALSEPALKGQAFFENAGGSYPCAPVVERLARFYRERKVQPYAALRGLARRRRGDGRGADAAGRAAGGRDRRAQLRPVDQPEHLSCWRRRSATGCRRAPPIVVTDQDHEANSGAWRRLADDGFEIREWKIDPETGHLDPARAGGAAGRRGEAGRLSACLERGGRDQRCRRRSARWPMRPAR